jgi:tetratricopeptide (TPR) repeat protein
MVLPLGAIAAEADKATEAFEAVYGADLKRVKATPDVKDDLELATRLFAAAKEAAGQPEFLNVLCVKAFELATVQPNGYPTAIAAMELLASGVPGKRVWCAERVVEVRQWQFDAVRTGDRATPGEELITALLDLADLKSGAPAEGAALCRRAEIVARTIKSDRLAEIDARQKALAVALKTLREADSLKALIEMNPQNAQVRERLVRLYLVDLDNPVEAAKYVEGVADPPLAKYVAAAAKGLESAPELAAKELGQWYVALAERALAGAKAAMYARAKAYYERFLELHTAEDLDRTTVAMVLKKVAAELATLTAPPGTVGAATDTIIAPGKAVDVLKSVDPQKDTVKGQWKMRDGGLRVESNEAAQRIALPVVVAGSYEFEVEFTRTGGFDNIVFIVPVAMSEALISLNAFMDTAIFEATHGQGEPKENKVKVGKLQNDRKYSARVQVLVRGADAQVTVSLDGKRVLGWTGPHAALTRPGDWGLPRHQGLGMGTWCSNVVFHSAKLKMLSGKAKLLGPNRQPAGTDLEK